MPLVPGIRYGVTISNSDLHGRHGVCHLLVHQLADHLAALDLLLVRAVVDELRGRPDERTRPGDDAGQRLAGLDPAGVIGAVSLDLPPMLVERLAIGVEIEVRGFAIGKRGRRDRERAIPEFVEGRR